MRVIDKIVVDNKIPTNHNVLWVDISQTNESIPRIYRNGLWVPLSINIRDIAVINIDEDCHHNHSHHHDSDDGGHVIPETHDSREFSSEFSEEFS